MKFSKEIRIGALAIIAIALSIWGYKFLLGKNVLQRTNVFYIKYHYVDGLRESNPVQVNGFQVGTVQALDIDPNNLDTVIVTIDMRKDIPVPKGTIARLMAPSPLGTRVIVLEFGGECCAKSGDYLQGETYGMVKSLLSPDDLSEYMQRLKMGIGAIVDTLKNSALEGGDDPLAKTMKDITASMANLHQITNSLNVILANSSKSLQASFANLASITGNIKDNNAHIGAMLGRLDTISQQIQSADIGTSIQSLSGNLGLTLDSLRLMIATTQATMASANGLLQGINKGEGSLGLLAKDDQVYVEMQRTLRNLDLMLQDFRLNPKRYVNVSVFGKKQKIYEVPENDPAFKKDTIHK
ncbi:MAG: MCE family protein [Saprospiraceae bacterium]|nr:MCE family protein [Saprospiraceae bacterium]MCB9320565.1 MCE family protein [Lewinellaceae bacterium]